MKNTTKINILGMVAVLLALSISNVAHAGVYEGWLVTFPYSTGSPFGAMPNTLPLNWHPYALLGIAPDTTPVYVTPSTDVQEQSIMDTDSTDNALYDANLGGGISVGGGEISQMEAKAGEIIPIHITWSLYDSNITAAFEGVSITYYYKRFEDANGHMLTDAAGKLLGADNGDDGSILIATHGGYTHVANLINSVSQPAAGTPYGINGSIIDQAWVPSLPGHYLLMAVFHVTYASVAATEQSGLANLANQLGLTSAQIDNDMQLIASGQVGYNEPLPSNSTFVSGSLTTNQMIEDINNLTQAYNIATSNGQSSTQAQVLIVGSSTSVDVKP